MTVNMSVMSVNGPFPPLAARERSARAPSAAAKTHAHNWHANLPPSPHPRLDDRPEHDPQDVLVAVYPQDPLVDRDEAIVIPFPSSEIQPAGSKLNNDYFVTRNVRSPHLIRPDRHGDYIFAPGTPAFSQVNAHVHATRVIHMVSRFLGAEVPWRFGNERDKPVAIRVNHDRSDDSGTIPSSRTIDLDTCVSRTLHKEVRAAECADCIAHEVGHDILQGVRPKLDDEDNETNAFHEAVGDIVAIFYALEFPGNTRRALEETGGNLHRQNLIARLFEEQGKAWRLRDHPEAHNGFYLRSAINETRYAPPGKGFEEHNFSRPYTAAFYDSLIALYERNCKSGMEPESALLQARDKLGTVWAHSLDFLPPHKVSFTDGLNAMLQADKKLRAGVGSVIADAFARRDIFPRKALPRTPST